MKKITLKISGMHCASCSMNIDGELEDTKGVSEASTSYAKQETEVKFDEENISQEDLIKVIEKTGYQAQLKTEN